MISFWFHKRRGLPVCLMLDLQTVTSDVRLCAQTFIGDRLVKKKAFIVHSKALPRFNFSYASHNKTE